MLDFDKKDEEMLEYIKENYTPDTYLKLKTEMIKAESWRHIAVYLPAILNRY